MDSFNRAWCFSLFFFIIANSVLATPTPPTLPRAIQAKNLDISNAGDFKVDGNTVRSAVDNFTEFKLYYIGADISPCNYFLTMVSASAWITHDPLVPFQGVGTYSPPNFYGVQLSYVIKKLPPAIHELRWLSGWFNENFVDKAVKDGRLSECNGTMFIQGEPVLDFKIEVATPTSRLRPAEPRPNDVPTSKRTLEARGSRQHSFDPNVTTIIRPSNSSETVKDLRVWFLRNIHFGSTYPAVNPDKNIDYGFGGRIGGTYSKVQYYPVGNVSIEDYPKGKDIVESVVDLMEWECAQPDFVYATADIVKNHQPSHGKFVVAPFHGWIG